MMGASIVVRRKSMWLESVLVLIVCGEIACIDRNDGLLHGGRREHLSALVAVQLDSIALGEINGVCALAHVPLMTLTTWPAHDERLLNVPLDTEVRITKKNVALTSGGWPITKVRVRSGPLKNRVFYACNSFIFSQWVFP